MPMRRAVLITRQAISPRLAIRIFLNMGVPASLSSINPAHPEEPLSLSKWRLEGSFDPGLGQALEHVAERRALDRHKRVDRHRAGMLGQGRERMEEADPVGAVLAHADDPAAADVDPGLADPLERLETVVEGPGGDDLV